MGPVVLRFHLVPPEHRVVVTPTDVKAATGKYLVRVFGGSTHAAVSDGARGPLPPSPPLRRGREDSRSTVLSRHKPFPPAGCAHAAVSRAAQYACYPRAVTQGPLTRTRTRNYPQLPAPAP